VRFRQSCRARPSHGDLRDLLTQRHPLDVRVGVVAKLVPGGTIDVLGVLVDLFLADGVVQRRRLFLEVFRRPARVVP